MKSLPVVAVIPAYNAESSLGPLLNEVLEQEYDDVYILDDASVDNTLEVAYACSKDVVIVEGEVNLGSGANRNRIISELGHSAIIHFLDADVRINSSDNPIKAREAMSDSSIGLVGGLIRHNGGLQMPYNYGPKFSLPEVVSGWLYSPTYLLETHSPATGKWVRDFLDRHWPLMTEWPDPLKEPRPRDVYWCAEANTVIRSDIFSATGGYDPTLRYHEVLEYSMRLAKLGLRRRFEPGLDVTHQAGPNINNNSSSKDFWVALAKIAGKMSLKDLLSSY